MSERVILPVECWIEPDCGGGPNQWTLRVRVLDERDVATHRAGFDRGRICFFMEAETKFPQWENPLEQQAVNHILAALTPAILAGTPNPHGPPFGDATAIQVEDPDGDRPARTPQ